MISLYYVVQDVKLLWRNTLRNIACSIVTAVYKKSVAEFFNSALKFLDEEWQAANQQPGEWLLQMDFTP
jgi:hypothetical protein